ncbi:SDR family NAD(P)-dependent oxidoreductase [Limosilactobacillus vaginalis]|uniref:SDR family NAD(P)-dependent oxidoreductase n=1 Tax=Limosilactobacillus vaginalis TaxID=1633 RepID=UPI001F08ADB1|nr:SDR family oxidoreductase [Limosilactobacillus vaginalis]
MEMGLQNKTALITGSTKGIGKAIAKVMAAEGVNVIINGRKAADVDAAVAEIKAAYPTTNPQGAAFDLADPAQQTALFDAFPQVDILVNNMGIFQPMDYQAITDDVWERFFKVNVLSGNALAKFYLPKMLDQDFGRIIFIASEEAVMPSGEMPQYSMTKTMNLSLAKSLSKLTKGTNVTVNTVMPGPTKTEGVAAMLEDMYGDSDLPKEEWGRAFVKEHRPLSMIQRLIEPTEIGRFVTFVASPYSTGFSGEALRMEGGLVPTLY